MPVDEKPVMDQNKTGAEHRYEACANKKRRAGYWAPNRLYSPIGDYIEITVFVPDNSSQTCRYDMSDGDPACAECGQRGAGKLYVETMK